MTILSSYSLQKTFKQTVILNHGNKKREAHFLNPLDKRCTYKFFVIRKTYTLSNRKGTIISLHFSLKNYQPLYVSYDKQTRARALTMRGPWRGGVKQQPEDASLVALG